MKYLFSVLLFCLALAGHTQEVIKFRDLPDGVDITRKEFNAVVDEYEAEKAKYDIVLLPLERIVTDVQPSVANRSSNRVTISSWGRDQLMPESIRQRVIDECGKYKVVVVTVDSGVDPVHPEYSWMKWLPSANYTGTVGRHWHGTHVTGCTYQLIGEVADRWGNFEFKDAQILNSGGSGSFAWGVNMAKAETALFIPRAQSGDGIIFNNSWGADIADFPQLTAELEKSRAAGMIWVGAAGNSGRVTNGYPGQSPYLTSVAALDPNTRRSSFSTMNDSIDVAAPGSNILSTLPNGQQGNASGTSMASPFITGVAALAYGKYGPVLQGEAMNIYLRYIATDITPTGRDNQTGWGITFVTTMLNTNPCSVAGIKCGGTPPPPDPDPEEPTPPAPDPGLSYVAGTSTGSFQMYWKRQSDANFRVMVFTEVEWQGIANGNETAAYKALKNEVVSYFANRAIVLTDQMGEWSAAKWTGRFLEIISKNNGTEVEVESITGRDEFGNVYRATNDDINPSGVTSTTDFGTWSFSDSGPVRIVTRD